MTASKSTPNRASGTGKAGTSAAKSALNYLIYVEGVPFVEAVRLLCEESPGYVPTPHEQVERKRPPFRLPPIAENCDRITRYLLGRGISNAVIQYCIERKILYESAEYHNCVFLGKTRRVCRNMQRCAVSMTTESRSSGRPAAIRHTDFVSRRAKNSSTVAVFEAAIDAMAEMTLCGSMANKWRLSLGGISASEKEPPALQEFYSSTGNQDNRAAASITTVRAVWQAPTFRKSTLTTIKCWIYRPTLRAGLRRCSKTT